MWKSGRPKQNATLDLENFFIKHEEEFVIDGKILPPSHNYWTSFRVENKVKKTEKVIYTAALKWYTKLTKNNKQTDKDERLNNVSIETSFDVSTDTNFDSSKTSNDRSPKKNAKNIKIKISPKVWRTIAPIELSYKRKSEVSRKTGVRKYFSLQPGVWTNVFAKEIAKHDDIPCSWVFKKNKCYLSGDKFLEFEGKCNVCSAILIGLLKNKPEEDETVTIRIEIFDIDSNRHVKEGKKVKLTSKAAMKIYSQNKTATVIRRNILKESTQMFTAPKARTMSANAIRCGQYRQRKSQKISECPLTALNYLKSSNLYMNCIQRIGWDPFFVFYCTPEQTKLFNEFKKRNKDLKVSCDATGGVVHKLGKSNKNILFKRQNIAVTFFQIFVFFLLQSHRTSRQ